METAVEEWLTAARDDLETVSEILDNPRLTHVVAFHTHSKSTSSLARGATVRREGVQGRFGEARGNGSQHPQPHHALRPYREAPVSRN